MTNQSSNMPQVFERKDVIKRDPVSGEIVEVDFRQLSQYEYHAKKDAQYNIYRVGNELMKQLEIIQPRSWRVLEMAIKKLNLYSAEIPQHKDFIEGIKRGEKYVPPQYRTIEITAEEFCKTYGLSERSGMVQFTEDVLSLMNERLFDVIETDGGAEIITQPVLGGVSFYVRRGRGEKTVTFSDNEMITGRDEKKPAHVCTKVKMELSMYTASGLFLIMDRFTRINSNITTKLKPSAHKLYTLMCIERASTPNRETWQFTWDLSTWNSKLGTGHKSMSTLIRTFKADKEISAMTDITAISYPEESSKSGKSYTLFTVQFKSNSGFKLIQDSKADKDSLCRPNLPRRSKAAQIENSHEQGQWARACIKILRKYKADCEKAGKTFPKRDRLRLDNCLKIIGEKR